MADVLELAEKFENECNYEGALEKLEMAFDEKLGSFYIRSDMGRVLNKMKCYDDALSCFNLVLPNDENHIDSLFGKGISCIGLNRLGEALESFNKILLIDDTNANAWYYKSIISKAFGDLDANIFFKKFIEYDNDEFKEIRSYYKFGIFFDEIEYNFLQGHDLRIYDDIKSEIDALNLDGEEQSKILISVPLEDLFDKILEIKKLNFKKETENAIRQELIKQGFSNSNVDEMFSEENIEDIKSELLSLSNEIILPDEKDYTKLVPIKLACRYSLHKNIKTLKKNNLLLFNSGNFYYDAGVFNEAKKCYDECLLYNPEFKELEFLKSCAEYNLRDDVDV